MSKHEWKPGDVALVVTPRTRFPAWKRTGDLWVDEEGVEFTAHHHDDWTIRPLVVIDPEDREQVKRLRDKVGSREGYWPGLEQLQAALREFASPASPEPEEPRGLGAVVEDAEGARWVRAGGTISHPADDWRCIEGEHVGWWAEYSKITAVRVLSEGVS